LNNSTAIAAGALATSNIKAADIFAQLLYVFWFIHCGSLATAVVYCGSRLLQTLGSQLKQLNTTSERYSKIKTGIFKVTCIQSRNTYIYTTILLLTVILDTFNGN
jgi:hypothetical protein